MNPDIGTTESTIIDAGYQPLSGQQLAQTIVGKTLLGDYGYLFKFIVAINANGSIEGKNNAGAHHFGKWVIDEAEGTISLQWDSGWDNTTNRAYAVDGLLKLFDVNGGEWRTTFTSISDGLQKPLIAPQ